MVVVFSYHTLIQRDSKYIDRRWKSFIVGILFIVISCSLTITFSLKNLMNSFDNHCVLNTEYAILARRTNESFLIPIPRTDVPLDIPMEIPEKIVLSPTDTMWGNMDKCNFGYFAPVVCAIFTIIWLTIFVMCGHGGKDDYVLLSQPWRIVVPALVYFGIMTIFSFAYLLLISGGLGKFCIALQQAEIGDPKDSQYQDNLEYPDCHPLMNKYAFNGTMTLSPGVNYDMSLVFSQLLFCFWLLAFIIMLVRCIFVIDFQLVRVTLTLQPKNDRRGSYSENLSADLLATSTATEVQNAIIEEIENLPVLKQDDNADDIVSTEAVYNPESKTSLLRRTTVFNNSTSSVNQELSLSSYDDTDHEFDSDALTSDSELPKSVETSEGDKTNKNPAIPTETESETTPVTPPPLPPIIATEETEESPKPPEIPDIPVTTGETVAETVEPLLTPVKKESPQKRISIKPRPSSSSYPTTPERATKMPRPTSILKAPDARPSVSKPVSPPSQRKPSRSSASLSKDKKSDSENDSPSTSREKQRTSSAKLRTSDEKPRDSTSSNK